MDVTVRSAVDSDRETYIGYAVQLGKFNRKKHSSQCTYDDFNAVLEAIRKNAAGTFDSRNGDTLLLIAELDGKPVGYALGRIFEQDANADNGTGRMGLFDELFLEDSARGYGLGRKLIDAVMNWMKEQGVHRVKLHAYSWNEHAQKLYKKNGFEEYVVSYEKFI